MLHRTGLFYVIEGFLDILLPVDDKQQEFSTRPAPQRPHPKPHQSNGSAHPDEKSRKPLFTVKPGGIAGYLSKSIFRRNVHVLLIMRCVASLCNPPSYVDIQAKTDTYVGFLPSHALDRLLEKRPIVLLTLAKRLISLLSPLGE